MIAIATVMLPVTKLFFVKQIVQKIFFGIFFGIYFNIFLIFVF